MADALANGTRPNPPHRVDTSMCDHLRGSLDLDATVKREPEDGGRDAQAGAPASTWSKLEKRFADVVRWGGVREGVKRRKVSWRLLSPQDDFTAQSLAQIHSLFAELLSRGRRHPRRANRAKVH